MKKYFLSFFLIIAFAFYVMLENQSSISVVSSSQGNSTGTAGGETVSSQTPVPSNTTSAPVAVENQPSQKPAPVAPAPTTPTPTGLYRDGSYDGDSVNAYFGNVQVEAIVSAGKLSDVKILAYPADRGTSVRINNGALPKLVKEAIASQSANVDVVSGATQTSQGFSQSLASALAKAKS